MPIDFRGLENLIKCDYNQCSSKILSGKIIILKPCYQFYCSNHFVCRNKVCNYCDENNFSSKQTRGVPFCFIENILKEKMINKCHQCKRDHKDESEFKLEYEQDDLLDKFIQEIKNQKEILNIKETNLAPQKKVLSQTWF